MLVLILLLGYVPAPMAGIAYAGELVAAGDLASEDFNYTATGTKPAGAGWSYKEVKGSISVAEVPDASDKSLRIERTETDTAGNLYARKTLEQPLTGRYVVRTKVMAEQTDAVVMALQAKSSANQELAVVMLYSDGKIRAQSAAGNAVMQAYGAGTWYDIAAVIDTAAKQYSVFVDGALQAGPIPFKNEAAENLGMVDLQVYRTTTGMAYYSDLHVYSTSLAQDETATELALGANRQLAASAWPPLPGLQAVSWSSDNPGIVQVNQDGTVTAVGTGTAVITATSSTGASAQCAVTVPSGPQVAVTGLALLPAELQLYEGETREITALLAPIHASNKQVSWSSSNPSVVSVTYSTYGSTAQVAGLLAGEAFVEAVSEDGSYTAAARITVREPGDLFSESFDSYPAGARPSTLSIPQTAGITTAVYDNPSGAGKALRIGKPDATGSSYYVSKSVPAGHGKLRVSLKAMAAQTNAVVYAATIRNSAGAPVVYLAFHGNGNIAVMKDGSWQSLKPYEANRWYRFDLALDAAAGVYELYIDGEAVGAPLGLIAALDEVKQVQFGIYGQSAGSAYFDDINYYSYKPATGVELASPPPQLAIGDAAALQARMIPANATFSAVTWTSSAPEIIGVDEFGLARALAAGEAIITVTARDGGYTASAAIQSYVQAAEGIMLDPSAFTLPLGSDRLLQAAVLPPNATDKNVTWSSSNPAVAYVNESGRVYSAGLGTAVITAAAADGLHTAHSEVTVVSRTVQETYYVAPDGNDSNPGTLAQPFQTIQKARDLIRSQNGNMTGDIVVYLRAGSYNQQETLLFDERDSGSNGYRIIYRAYEEENPVIEGGRQVTGWTLHDGERGIYKAAAGGELETRQLYVNGIRAVRARSQGGLINPVRTETGYLSDDTALAGWGNISDLEFVFKAEWTNPRNGVASVEEAGGKAVITMKQPGWRYVTVRPSVVHPWYLENAYELLDEPGEWYLDRSTDTFYYMPRPGENMAFAHVVAPVVEELVKVEGSSLDAPVHDISFEGLTFSYTTWLRPSSDMGHADAQNNLLRYGIDTLPISAVTVQRADHIRFLGNTFSKLGIMGLKMVNGVQESLIQGNRFFDISGGAINIGDPTKLDPEISNPSDPRKWIVNVDILNNYIHHIGVDYRSSAAIGVAFPVDMDISHNEIFDVPYDGITIGYGLAHVKTSTLRNARIQHNFIHDIMGEEIYDGGAIYTLGGTGASAEAPNLITDNYIRNQMNRYGAIYNDQGSSFWHSERNVVDLSETPVWDEIFPATWGFVNGVLESHHITFNNNYATTEEVKVVGVNSSVANTHVYPDAQWPQAALDIIAQAGLQPAYEGLKGDTPERIAVPSKLQLETGDTYALQVSAVTGKDEPVDLSVTTVTYSTGNPAVAVVDGTGLVEAIGPGSAVITVHALYDGVLKHKKVPVYVDDQFDRLQVYYAENKTKNLIGEELSMVLGGTMALKTEALSLYGQKLEMPALSFASSNPAAAQIDSQGVLTVTGIGTAEITVSAMVEGVLRTRVIAFSSNQYGDPAGLLYDPYSLEDVIADDSRWYVYATGGGGSLTAEEGSLTISTPGGFASYQGEQFQDELFTMDLKINGTGGWPSLALRNQRWDRAFTSADNSLYLICFKPDVIELHRFNNGERTVIYGNVPGYTSIGGNAAPNQNLPFNEVRRVQAGAVNEAGGVRLIVNIDGVNIFYFLDTAAERLESPGYFGLYARSGSMTLIDPQLQE
jgi:uncharacterized protein YjdB